MYKCTTSRIPLWTICYHRYKDSRQITVTHACRVSLFLPYGSPIMLHVLLFHVTIFILYDCFPLLILLFSLLDTWAVDMPYVESHIYCSRFPLYCSRFPLYCSMLSTELRSSYQVNCIMYCICSCYIVYLTYQIIKLTGVWGRLDSWLDLIGWCTGSILLVPLQGTVVIPTNCSMSSRYLIHAPLLAEGPGLSSQGFV